MEQFGMRMFAIMEYVGGFHEDQSDTLGLGTKAYFLDTRKYKSECLLGEAYLLGQNNQLWVAP